MTIFFGGFVRATRNVPTLVGIQKKAMHKEGAARPAAVRLFLVGSNPEFVQVQQGISRRSRGKESCTKKTPEGCAPGRIRSHSAVFNRFES